MVRWFRFFFFAFSSFSSIGWGQLNSHFLLQNESFLSPQFEATNQSQYQFVGFQLSNSLDSEKLILDSEAVMAVGSPLLNYIKFREAAIVLPSSNQHTLIIGRKKMLWSELDEAWSMGTIEPVFKWNPLNRESHGLVGLFWVTQQPWFQFTAFVSPVYLPDQGPNFEINRDGQFAKTNPWFQRPPRTFQPFPGSDSSSVIQYNVRKPPESEVITQTSLGGSIEGALTENTIWRAAYFYKPMNQLALGYDGTYNTGTDVGEVEILPQVAYHRVTAADLVYSVENYRIGFSYIKDKPEPFKFDPEWTIPILSEAHIYAPFIQYNLRKHSFRLDYLTMDGGRIKEVGEFASETRAPITSRYPYREAVRGSYEVEVPLKRREKFKFSFSWTHSEKNQFDLVQTKGLYQFSKRWQTYMDLQVVKAQALTNENANEISPHENNDRFMLGISYEL